MENYENLNKENQEKVRYEYSRYAEDAETFEQFVLRNNSWIESLLEKEKEFQK